MIKSTIHFTFLYRRIFHSVLIPKKLPNGDKFCLTPLIPLLNCNFLLAFKLKLEKKEKIIISKSHFFIYLSKVLLTKIN